VWGGDGDEQQRYYDLIYSEIAAVSAFLVFCEPSAGTYRSRSCLSVLAECKGRRTCPGRADVDMVCRGAACACRRRRCCVWPVWYALQANGQTPMQACRLTSVRLQLLCSFMHKSFCWAAGVFESSSGTWSTVRGFSDAMSGLSGAPLTSCTNSRPAAPAAPPCGRGDGTGYEGGMLLPLYHRVEELLPAAAHGRGGPAQSRAPPMLQCC
jgi:hypothetical protein